MKLFGTPRHASRKRDKEQGEEYSPQFALPGANELVSLKEEPWSDIITRWVQALFLYILLLVVIVATLYSGLAASVLVISQTGDESGQRDLVVRNLWQDNGGKPPVGEQAVISTTTPLPEDFFGKITIGWTGIPQPATVEVASDHMDKLTVKGNQVLVGEEWHTLTPSAAYQPNETATTETPVQLDDQFLVKCVVGACETDTFLIIDRDNIYGERNSL